MMMQGGGKEKGAVGKGAKKGKAGGTGPATEAVENVEPEDMSPEALEEKAGVLVDTATIANLKSSAWKERLEGGDGDGDGVGEGGIGMDFSEWDRAQLSLNSMSCFLVFLLFVFFLLFFFSSPLLWSFCICVSVCLCVFIFPSFSVVSQP